MSSQLSTGAVHALTHAEEENPIATEPVLQVLSVKKVVSAAASSPDRYRLVVSDGQYFMQAMLSTQLNDLVSSEPAEIQKNTIVQLLTYATNIVGNRRIVIALTVKVLETPGDRIGSPVTVDNAPAPAAAADGDVAMEDVKPAVKPAAPAARANNNNSNNNKGAVQKKNAGGGGRDSSGAPIYPIEGLSPYQNKWTIKARVTVKSDIRHWSNAKGDGKLFSVNLLDDTGEIKATGFNEEVDRLYNLFEEGKVYFVSKARVNIAKKQFSNLASEYEISLSRDTEVSLCDDQDSAPQIKYSFVELSELANLEKDATCDVLGIVSDNGDISEITTKATQKQLKKREVTICDKSGYAVRVTLWGKSAESWEDSDHGVVAFKGARVGDFGGRTLSMGGGSTMAIDPDIPQAHELRGWYDTEGTTKEFSSFSTGGGSGGGGVMKKDDYRTLEDAKEDDSLGHGEKPDYFNARATIILIKADNLYYPACPSSDKCNKKVSQEGNEQWRCEKCDRVFDRAEYRYIASMCVGDYTNQMWLSGFNDVGLTIIGKSADDMVALKDEDEGEFNRVLAHACGKMYDFSVRAKAETYGDQTRVKYTIQRLKPVNFVEAARSLLDDIALWG